MKPQERHQLQDDSFHADVEPLQELLPFVVTLLSLCHVFQLNLFLYEALDQYYQCVAGLLSIFLMAKYFNNILTIQLTFVMEFRYLLVHQSNR